MTTTGLLSLGMLFVILTGVIDLSVGSIVGFFGDHRCRRNGKLGVPGLVVAPAGHVSGAFWGLISGSLVACFRWRPSWSPGHDEFIRGLNVCLLRNCNAPHYSQLHRAGFLRWSAGVRIDNYHGAVLHSWRSLPESYSARSAAP